MGSASSSSRGLPSLPLRTNQLFSAPELWRKEWGLGQVCLRFSPYTCSSSSPPNTQSIPPVPTVAQPNFHLHYIPSCALCFRSRKKRGGGRKSEVHEHFRKPISFPSRLPLSLFHLSITTTQNFPNIFYIFAHTSKHKYASSFSSTSSVPALLVLPFSLFRHLSRPCSSSRWKRMMKKMPLFYPTVSQHLLRAYVVI